MHHRLGNYLSAHNLAFDKYMTLVAQASDCGILPSSFWMEQVGQPELSGKGSKPSAQINATTLLSSMMQAARVHSSRIGPLLSSMTDSKPPGAPRLLDEYRSTSVDTRALVCSRRAAEGCVGRPRIARSVGHCAVGPHEAVLTGDSQ